MIVKYKKMNGIGNDGPVFNAKKIRGSPHDGSSCRKKSTLEEPEKDSQRVCIFEHIPDIFRNNLDYLAFKSCLLKPQFETSQYSDKPLGDYSIIGLNSHHSKNTVIYSFNGKDILGLPLSFNPKKLYDKLNAEASCIKLEPDPVIEMLKDSELSIKLMNMQSEFKRAGFSRFSHNALRIPLKNIRSVLLVELTRSKEDKEQANQIKCLKEDVTKLYDENESPFYKDVLILSLRYALLITVLKAYPYIDSAKKLKAMCIINKYNFDELPDEQCDIDDELNEALGIFSDGLCCQHIIKYLRGQRDYLMWPCFDELDLEFFVKSSRYNIFPAGLLKGNIEYHDDKLMHCLRFMQHDFIHVKFIRGVSVNVDLSDDTKAKQKIIKKIIDAIEKENLDNYTRQAVWLWLFFCVHEFITKKDTRSLILLESEGFLNQLDEEGLMRSIVRGFYKFKDKALKIIHVHRAHAFLVRTFPTVNMGQCETGANTPGQS